MESIIASEWGVMLKLAEIKNAVVIGANGGIGLALTKRLLNENPNLHIHATFRSQERSTELARLKRISTYQVDATDEEQLKAFAEKIGEEREIELLIVATGILHDPVLGIAPERSVKELSLPALIENFRINACITPLVAKHLAHKFSRKSPSAFVAISARVGSIEDNRLGGWYAYRASKAALNMFVKTLSIELKRTISSEFSIMAIHPGTNRSRLSLPFLKNIKHKVMDPDESAQHILATIERCHSEGSGLFKTYDGKDLPW